MGVSYGVKKLRYDALKTAAVEKSCILRDGKIFPALSAFPVSDGIDVNFEWAYYSPIDNRTYFYGINSLLNTDDKAQYYSIGEIDSKPFAYFTGGSENYGFLTKGKHITRGRAGYSVKSYTGAVRNGVYKNGRIFGVDVSDCFKIKWSGAGDAKNWSEGAGWVRISTAYGGIYKLVLLGDVIAAVCKYGIVVLNAHGDPETFSLSYPCPHLSQIFPESAQATDKLYFLTADGAYSFDGSGAKKLGFGYARLLKTVTGSVSLGNDYFVCGADGSGAKITAVLNTQTGESYFIDCGAEVLTAEDKVYGFGKNVCCSLKTGGEYLYKSGEFDFETAGYKTVTKIEIQSGKAVDIEVSNGVKSRIFAGVSGSVRPNLRGKKFTVTVRGESEVSRLVLTAEAIDGI